MMFFNSRADVQHYYSKTIVTVWMICTSLFALSTLVAIWLTAFGIISAWFIVLFSVATFLCLLLEPRYLAFTKES